MGTWGTGLSSNDTFEDVYDEFFELYNNGHDVQEITTKLLETNRDLLDDKGDSNNFWFAIAKGQWECKSLDNEVYKRVKDIIENKKDLEVWKELGSNESDINKRDKVLAKFLADISTEKERAKKRKKKKIIEPAFEKGTCLTFKLLNGNFGAAIVLEAIYGTPYGHNLIVITDLNKKDRPNLQEVINATVLRLNFASWDNKEQIGWLLSNYFKKDADKFEVIGKTEIKKTYDPTKDKFSYSTDWFIWTIEIASLQFENGKKNWFNGGTKIKTYL